MVIFAHKIIIYFFCMAKGITEDQIKYTIELSSSKAQQELHKMDQRLKELTASQNECRRQMTRLEASGQKNSDMYIGYSKRLKELNPQVRQLKEQIKEQTSALDVSAMSMAQLKKQSRELQRALDNVVQSLNPEEYEEIEKRLSQVNGRMAELRQNVKSWKEIAASDQTNSFFFSNVAIKTLELFGNKLSEAVGKMRELIAESISMAESADGVIKAFDKLDNQNILNDLRTATKGTVNDLELMKAVLQAKDFRIPLEDMGKYLAFAQLKAQETGQSVEYMTTSIVTGLGRKSALILDNLGISAGEIAEKTKETGDFMKAVAAIVDNQLAAAGKAYISAQDKALQKTTELQNAQLELGKTLLPYKQMYSDVFGGADITFTKLLTTLMKHEGVVKAVAVAIGVMTTASILCNKALWTTIAHTKMATTAMSAFNLVCKSNVFILVASALAGLITYIVAFSKNAIEARDKMKKLNKEQEKYIEQQKELKKIQSDTNAELMRDIATLKSFNGTKEQEIELCKQMNTKYGEAMGYYKTVSQWYDALVKNSKLYCQQMVLEARIRSLASQAAEAEQNANDIRKDKYGKTRKYSKEKKKHVEKTVVGYNATTDQPIYDTKVIVEQSDLEKATAKYNAEKKKSVALQAEMNLLLLQQAKLQKQLFSGSKNDPFTVTPSPSTTTTKSMPSSVSTANTVTAEQNLEEYNNEQKLKAMQDYYSMLEQITSVGESKRQMTIMAERQSELEMLRAYLQAAYELAEQAGQDTEDLTLAGEAAKQRIMKKYADMELAQADENENKKRQMREQLGMDTVSEYEKQKQMLDDALNKQYISQEEYEKKVQKLKKESFIKQAQYYSSLFSDAFTALQDAEMAQVDAKYDAQIEAARQAGQDTTELENKKAQEKLAIEKKYADVNFAIKASQIIADTAVSIMMAYSQLGPIAGSIAAALMGITGAAQLAAANAERERVKKMTLSGSSSSSASGARVATGLESGGRIDVEREQDGKHFNAEYDPNRRGYIDRPTVIVGEGPTGQSKEWVASNAAVTNPTVAPILDIIDKAQRAGTVRTLDLRKFVISRISGRQSGGTISVSPVPASGAAATVPGSFAAGQPSSLSPSLIKDLTTVLSSLKEKGIKSFVALDDFDAQQKLRQKSRKIGSKL